MQGLAAPAHAALAGAETPAGGRSWKVSGDGPAQGGSHVFTKRNDKEGRRGSNVPEILRSFGGDIGEQGDDDPSAGLSAYFYVEEHPGIIHIITHLGFSALVPVNLDWLKTDCFSGDSPWLT